jgi:uncharacterized protein YqeY
MITKGDIETDLRSAMKSGEKIRLNTLRLVLTEVKLAEVAKKGPLDENTLLGIFQKQAKMRLETIADAKKAGREDMIPVLDEELAILKVYLPEPFSDEELSALVIDAIQQSQAQGPREMGKVMQVVMPQVQGRADGKVVSELVRALLTDLVSNDDE